MSNKAHIAITVHEAEKRPVSAAADHFETRNVVKVEIEQARAIELYMMFDRNHGLEERLLAEQFSF